MNFDYRKPQKMLVISDLMSDLQEAELIVKNFKSKGIQPGVFLQSQRGCYEEVFVINEQDLNERIGDERVFLSTATIAKHVKSGSSLFVALEKLQEFGLTLSIDENHSLGRIVIAYDPELEHLHSIEDGDYLV